MEISEQLLKFKFHVIFGIICSISVCILIRVAPSFLDLLAYFWPLLASTALFLAVVVVFTRVPPPTAEKTGEGLFDYVAGHPDSIAETFKSESILILSGEEESNQI